VLLHLEVLGWWIQYCSLLVFLGRCSDHIQALSEKFSGTGRVQLRSWPDMPIGDRKKSRRSKMDRLVFIGNQVFNDEMKCRFASYGCRISNPKYLQGRRIDAWSRLAALQGRLEGSFLVQHTCHHRRRGKATTLRQTACRNAFTTFCDGAAAVLFWRLDTSQ
jgi:hypothetical protein